MLDATLALCGGGSSGCLWTGSFHRSIPARAGSSTGFGVSWSTSWSSPPAWGWLPEWCRQRTITSVPPARVALHHGGRRRNRAHRPSPRGGSGLAPGPRQRRRHRLPAQGRPPGSRRIRPRHRQHPQAHPRLRHHPQGSPGPAHREDRHQQPRHTRPQHPGQPRGPFSPTGWRASPSTNSARTLIPATPPSSGCTSSRAWARRSSPSSPPRTSAPGSTNSAPPASAAHAASTAPATSPSAA